MVRDLDKQFSHLLEAIAKRENTTVEVLGNSFASEEIENRRTFYPQLKQVLSGQDLNIAEFRKIVTNCWASGGRYDIIQFGAFIKEEDAAVLTIQTLIKDFPQDDGEAAARIDAFIDETVRLGYKDKKGSPNRSAAAALCSVLLTSLFPDRFVDFKQGRWKEFARTLDYDILYPVGEGYGRAILWAGRFAADVAETASFRRVWKVEYPLWVLAGIAWVLPDVNQAPEGNSNHLPDTGEDTEITTLLAHKKQVILYGPPGTGKTYRAGNYISHQNAQDHKEFVTFHPSFGYEDFIEGLRPFTADDGTLAYRVEDGIFKTLSRRAFNVLAERAGIEGRWNESESIPHLDGTEKRELLKVVPEVPFYLVIDEINRGDISRIFGELITLLEADKRYCRENEIAITLPYSKEKFAIPPNLYIIGTMNTADKSISLVDAALRRRFGFIEMMPDYDVLRNSSDDKDDEVREIIDIATDALETINEKIAGNYDRDHRIGHSYLMKLRNAGSREEALEMLRFAWYHEIVPLLQEYYYDAPARFNEVIGSKFIEISPDERCFEICERLYGDEFLRAVEALANGNHEQGHAEPDE